MKLIGTAALFVSLGLCLPFAVSAQTDEIQVYDATIDEPGQASVELHNNYTPVGRKTADFPGGVIPDRALNGVPEWAIGVTEWMELGTYLPLYTITGAGHAELNGAKLRALFVVPNAKDQDFFYGVNFELSFNAKHWEETSHSGEIRPIVGEHVGPWEFIFNPIVDTNFRGLGQLDFAPAGRVAYNVSEVWAGAVEHYADFGQFRAFAPLNRQAQTTFLVGDYSGHPFSVEFGVGHGYTSASDGLVFKLMITREF